MSPKKSNISPMKSGRKTARTRSIGMQVGIVAIFVLTVVSFILYPALTRGQMGSKSHNVFGRYGNRDIAYEQNNYFGQEVARIAQAYQEQNVLQDATWSDYLRYTIWRQAFVNTAFLEARIYQMQASGFRVSDRAKTRALIKYGPYRTDGEFDETLFRQASAADKADLLDRYGESLALDAWDKDVRDGIYRSKAELAFLEAMRSPVSSYDYVVVPFTTYPDADVLAYGKDHAKLFSDIGLSRITVADEKTARDLLAQYKSMSGDIEAFGDLAAQDSTDSYKDSRGKMGRVEYATLTSLITTEQADEVFSKAVGEVAGPYNTSYGWILFKVDEAPAQADLASRISDIRSYMIQNETGMVEDAVLATAEDFRSAALGGAGFRGAAAASGYEVKTTGSFPVNFGSDTLVGATPTTDGNSDLGSAADSEDFWSKVAALKSVGDVSEPVILGRTVVVLSLASRKDASAIPAEYADYYASMIKDELDRSREAEYESQVTSTDNPLFKDNFADTYTAAFGNQGNQG